MSWEQKKKMTKPKQCRMVVGLIDIAGFPKVIENKSDLEMCNMLNDFYNLVGNVIGKAKGTVVKFMGDCGLVMFPEDKAKLAVASLRELSSLAKDIWTEFDEICTVRIRAHVGPVVMGYMGPEGRLDVIGNTINQLFLMPQDGQELSNELKQLVEQ